MAKFFKKLISGGYGGMNFGGGGGGGGYEFKPYSGARPIAPQYTAASEKALYDTILPRSQGVGVGYDPARKSSALALLTSENQKRREDDVRDAQGRVSASGLSGNLRAQEALTGRVQRDSARELTDSINALNVDDLTYASNERDRNTSRLQDFSNFQFGQGNKVADFDLGVYGQEEGFRGGAFDRNEGVRQYDQSQSDEFINSLLQGGAFVAGSALGGPGGGMAAGSAAQALAGGGKGIAPQYNFSDPMTTSAGPGYRKAYRSLVR